MKYNSLKVLCSVACIFVFQSALGDIKEVKGIDSNGRGISQNNRRQISNADRQQMEQQVRNLLRQIDQLTQETRQTIQQLQQLQDQRDEYARLEQQNLPIDEQEKERFLQRIHELRDSIPALEEQLQGQVSTELSGLWWRYNQAGTSVIPADWPIEKRRAAIQQIRETRANLLNQIREATQREIAGLNQHIEQGQREHDQLNAI